MLMWLRQFIKNRKEIRRRKQQTKAEKIITARALLALEAEYVRKQKEFEYHNQLIEKIKNRDIDD